MLRDPCEGPARSEERRSGLEEMTKAVGLLRQRDAEPSRGTA